MLRPTSYLQYTVYFRCQVSGVRCQEGTDDRSQMTDKKRQTVFCHLLPDTIDIVLFKELNWPKIYHMTFVTFLWDITLVLLKRCASNDILAKLFADRIKGFVDFFPLIFGFCVVFEKTHL